MLPTNAAGWSPSRDGVATAVHAAENVARQPVSLRGRWRGAARAARRSIEADGAELGAIYHSHTRSEPYPSQTDVNFAAGWPGVEWIIVGVAARR